VPSHVDALALIGDLLARTSRLTFFPDVVSLPLRPPATLAKQSAALDLLSGGRFELGLGRLDRPPVAAAHRPARRRLGRADPVVPALRKWAPANATIDAAARAAGREPSAVRRIAQVVGTITATAGDTDTTRGAAPLHGTPDQWAAFFAHLATEQPFRTFVFWPEHHTLDQIERFATEVVPATRELVAGR